MPSVASALLVLVAACGAIGEATAGHASAWTNLPKPPVKYSKHGSHSTLSKCGHLEACEVCVYEHGRWQKKHAPKNTPCDDGYYCNGEEKCNAHGKCKKVKNSVPKCGHMSFGSIDHQCGKAVCSERHKACKVAINPVACDDGDHCTTHDRCDIKTGQCYGIPKKCHGECQTCDTEHGCKSKCEDGEVCKHGKCVHEDEELEEHEPECTKGGHECDACHKCFFGKCVPKKCPKGKQCVAEDDQATCVVKQDDCRDGNCDEVEETCKETFDVTCYKCGNDKPLSCLVLGHPSRHELAKIQHAIGDTCEGDRRPRTCGGQRCDRGIITSVAPFTPKQSGGLALWGKEQCLWPFVHDTACPCLDPPDDENKTGLDAVAQYKVCLGHDGKAVVDTEEDASCIRVCGQGHKDKHCKAKLCIGDECTEDEGDCPQPHYCPKKIFFPVAAMSDGADGSEQIAQDEM